MNLSKLKAALACKIFDTIMISPILTCNSGIWPGSVCQPDFKTWEGSHIEKTHLQFCKRYLEVNKKASKLLVEQTELGPFPLNITLNQNIFNCILYIQSKDEESFVKQSFVISFDLCNGKNSFHSHLMNMTEYFNLPDFNPNILDNAMIKSYVS